MLTSYDDNKTVQQDKKIILCQREMKIHISGFDGSKFGIRSPIQANLLVHPGCHVFRIVT